MTRSRRAKQQTQIVARALDVPYTKALRLMEQVGEFENVVDVDFSKLTDEQIREIFLEGE